MRLVDVIDGLPPGETVRHLVARKGDGRWREAVLTVGPDGRLTAPPGYRLVVEPPRPTPAPEPRARTLTERVLGALGL